MTTLRCGVLITLLFTLAAGADDRTPTSNDDLIEFPSAELVLEQQQARQAGDAILSLFQTRRVSPKFDNQPLDQVVQQLAKLTKTSFQIDVRALAEEGIGPDSPITFNARKPQRVADVLDRLLQPLQLSWYIDGNVVRVTTAAKTNVFLQTRAYRVGRLLRLVVERDVRLPRSPSMTTDAEGNLQPAAIRGDMAAASRKLEEALQEATSGPWEQRDGEGGNTPRVVAERMLVQQTQQAHREINALLRTVELILSRPFGSAPLLVTETDEELTELTRMQRLLETEIEFNFTDAPLTDVTKRLSDKLDEEIAIDIEALTEEGIRTDSPVTFQGRFAAGIALSQILEPLQLAHQFRHGAVYVTTIAKSKERLQTVVYDVADFLQVGHSMQGLLQFIEDSTAGPWLNTGGEGGTQTEFPGGVLVIRQIANVHDEIASLLGGLRKTLRAAAQSPRTKESEFQTRFLQARSKAEAKAIERLLRTFVAPATWDSSGGRGLIGTADDRIVIRQTKAVHEQIDRFLREYQQATPVGQAAK